MNNNVKVDKGSQSAFQKVPLFSKISTKFTAIILVLAIIPLLLVSYYLFNAYKASLEQQVTEDLVLIAESKEGHFFGYMEKITGRVVDFSSDGYIRDSVQEIINNPENKDVVNQLNWHLKNNKMVIDEIIYGINVIGLDGKIIASTSDIEIGHDEREHDYFTGALTLPYGEAMMSDLEISHHFVDNSHIVMTSAPLTNKNTGERIGVLVNYYNTQQIDDILAGRQQEKSGAISGLLGQRKTVDVYLVNKDKLMITESRFFGKDVFLEQTVNTEPVKACLESQEEISGSWLDYRDKPVYGASMCIIHHDHNWTLLVEIDEEEVLQPVYDLRQILIIVVLLGILIIVVLGMYFSHKLTKPIKSLRNVAQVIADGDLTKRAEVKSKNEVGQLSQSFNQMTEALIKSGEDAKAIVKTLPEPLFILDKQGKITSANPAAQKILGYSEKELIGKSIKDVISSVSPVQRKEIKKKGPIRYVPAPDHYKKEQ